MEKDTDRVCEILAALSKSMREHFPKTAVSCKIRLPQEDDEMLRRIPKLIATGINHLAIHGRTLHENKTKVAACHVDRVALAASKAREIDPDFQIVANGGMEYNEDVRTILETTNANAAMSSEALLETPNIFQPSSRLPLTARERLRQQVGFARDYLGVCRDVSPPLPGVLGPDGSVSIMRGHLFKFLHRYLNEQHDLRLRLANSRGVRTLDLALGLVDELEGRYDSMSDDQMEEMPSANAESSWYRRHRKSDRRVHQKEVRVNSSFVSAATQGDGGNADTTGGLTVADKKRQIQERIAKMKASREARKRKQSESTMSV